MFGMSFLDAMRCVNKESERVPRAAELRARVGADRWVDGWMGGWVRHGKAWIRTYAEPRTVAKRDHRIDVNTGPEGARKFGSSFFKCLLPCMYVRMHARPADNLVTPFFALRHPQTHLFPRVRPLAASALRASQSTRAHPLRGLGYDENSRVLKSQPRSKRGLLLSGSDSIHLEDFNASSRRSR